MSEFLPYIEHGWALCPLRPGTKAPAGENWNAPENALTAARAAGRLLGAGLMHAYSGTMALDIDDYELADLWLEKRGVSLGDLLDAPDAVQIISGREGHGKLLYGCPAPFPSVRITEGEGADRRTILEFRCASRNGLSVQDVLPPSIHPETGMPYRWEGDWQSLPDLPDALLEVWLAEIDPAPLPQPSQPPATPPAASAGLDELRALLRHHDPNDTRDAWIRVGAALHHETAGSPEGLMLWDEWSQGSQKYRGLADLEKDWRGFRADRPDGVTAGYLRQRSAALPEEFEVVTEVVDEDLAIWAEVERAARSRFEPVHVAEVARRPPPEWIIEEVIPESEIVMMCGESGAGKSFMALDMAFAIATGEAWAGLRVKGGPVVWIAAEAAGSLRLRTKAYAHQTGLALENADLWVIDGHVSLMADEDASALGQVLAPKRPRMIIVDTLAAASGGANENSGEDMNIVLDHCRNLHRETGATIMLIHHLGKDVSKGARGWSGLKGAMQTELTVAKTDNGRMLQITKQRDGNSEGDLWNFWLHQVTLDDMTEACVVQTDERIRAHAVRVNTPKIRLGGAAKVLWGAITDLMVVEGAGVIIEDAYNRAIEKMPPPAQGRRDYRQQNVRRALTSLMELGYVTIKGDLIFLSGDENG
jgi:hypothetical protein